MKRFHLSFPALFALGLFACGPVEVRISKAQGVKPISGTLTADFNSNGQQFVCGDTIIGTDNTQSYTVTTSKAQGGCDFMFDQEVEVLAGASYETIKEFKDALHTLNRVELEVRRLDFYDDTGARFELSRLRELQLIVNGQEILNLDQVGGLPRTVVLSGEALDVIKRAVKNRERCTAHVVAHVLVLDAQTPTGVRCEYESQPTLVLSSASI